MKTDIHPAYYPTATCVCACGNVMVVGSTVPEIHVEICAKCHPFYTGKQKFIDTARRVEKYQERASMQAHKATIAASKKLKAGKRVAQKAAKKKRKTPLTLNEQ